MSPSLLWKEKHYFIPMELGTFNGLMYVTDLKQQQEFTDPKTFTELEALAEQLKGKGIPALLVANKEKWWALLCSMHLESYSASRLR
jgi:ABC-type glycerol-3-phosphate transport system substrate-binding protein